MVIGGITVPATGITTPDPAGDIEVVSVLSQFIYVGPTVQPYTPGTITTNDNLTPLYDGDGDPLPA